MVTVKKADVALFDQVYPLLATLNNPNLTEADFKYLFTMKWSSEYDHCGYVLMDQEEVVGFLGALFNERVIDGTLHKFCNLNVWVVKENYRKYSLQLLYSLLELKNYTITSLTPGKEISVILEKFQFKLLENTTKIFVFFPFLLRPLNFKISSDKNIIQSLLNKTDEILFHDHLLPICDHLIIYHQENYCYLIFNKIKKKKVGFTQIFYISDLKIFKQAFINIQFFFLKYNKTFFTLIDKRLLKDISLGISFEHRLDPPQLYHSSSLEPKDIDGLYTEKLLLRL